jgi:hypothetical protein
MRDPERIEEILSLIKELWLKNPDLRFNQLIYNLQYDYSSKNESVGQIKAVDSDGYKRIGLDLFNLEDDSFIDYLRSQISR